MTTPFLASIARLSPRNTCLLLVVLFAGCSSTKTPLSSFDARPDGTNTVGTDAILPDAIVRDAGTPDAGKDATAPKTEAECSAIAESLAKKSQLLGGCTAVVRLDSATLKILGHAFICGKYAKPDEQAARASATAAVVFPSARPAGEGRLLSGPAPQDEWVFYLSPGDFGGVSAVSATTGRTVFAASIIWSGTGKVFLPDTWDTSDLGEGCGKRPGATIRGFEATDRGGDLFLGYESIADVVLSTALPESFQRWGSLFNVVVLEYAAGVGIAMGPSTTTKPEYFVLLNGGWLE